MFAIIITKQRIPRKYLITSILKITPINLHLFIGKAVAKLI